MKTLLKGGTVVSAAGSRVADVLVDGEKIAAVGEGLAVDGAKVVDVRGKLLFPGFIDAHTHFDLDVCNTTTADNFDTGTRSAIHGGARNVIRLYSVCRTSAYSGLSVILPSDGGVKPETRSTTISS